MQTFRVRRCWYRPILGARIGMVLAVALFGATRSTLIAAQPVHAPVQPAIPQTARTSLPERLSDAEFWRLVSDISEPGGFFRISDNYTSNEREVGRLFTMLRDVGVSGGVYVGVGPEQNFSYIAAIRPAMAFVVDIRRQAVMQHLMFKAMFELSTDRADFISLLFGKPRPAGIDSAMPIQKIWDAYWPVVSDSAAAARNYARITDLLTRKHRFKFTAEESAQLESVFYAFYSYGPSISTRGAPGGRGGGNGATFADLTGYSFDDAGQPQSFLSTEENFTVVKGLHERNLIVPVSGDFGGPKAVRAIGDYLQKHGGVVSAFYVSNVEQYLFGDAKQGAFYDNVATLPVSEKSVFIRPYALRRGTASEALCPITAFLSAAKAGRVYSNNEVLMCVR
jgi:hypothetical protein